jgi:hypothetical protein
MSTECCSTPSEGKKCCPCKKFPGLLVILFGLTFLLRATGLITPHCAAITWPIIVIVGGAHFMFRDLCKCCKSESCKTESK